MVACCRSSLQLTAEEVAVVWLQVNFYRKMITHLQSLKVPSDSVNVHCVSTTEVNTVTRVYVTSSSVRWKCFLKLNG